MRPPEYRTSDRGVRGGHSGRPEVPARRSSERNIPAPAHREDDRPSGVSAPAATEAAAASGVSSAAADQAAEIDSASSAARASVTRR